LIDIFPLKIKRQLAAIFVCVLIGLHDAATEERQKSDHTNPEKNESSGPGFP